MNDLNEIAAFYFEKANDLKKASEALVSSKRGIKDTICKNIVNASQANLETYYQWLNQADKSLSQYVVIKKSGFAPADGPSATEVLAAELTIVSKAREVYVHSLSSYERQITDIENTLNFRLTTTLAVIAICVAIASAFTT